MLGFLGFKNSKGAFGFVIQDIVKNNDEYNLKDLCQKKPISIEVPKGIYREIYSDTVYFKRHRHWNIVGHKDGINIDLMHVIGCSLYNGDEYIKNLDSSESNQCRTFMSCGYKAVENIVSYYINNSM